MAERESDHGKNVGEEDLLNLVCVDATDVVRDANVCAAGNLVAAARLVIC